MFKWEIHCCDKSDQISDGYFPQPYNEITLFVYAETEEAALSTAKGKVIREYYQAVECVEEIPELIEGVGPSGS